MNTEERGETMNDVVALINELRSEERDYLNNYLANAPKWLLEAFQIVRLKKGTTFIHENAHVDLSLIHIWKVRAL